MGSSNTGSILCLIAIIPAIAIQPYFGIWYSGRVEGAKASAWDVMPRRHAKGKRN